MNLAALADRFYANDGTRKPDHYFGLYERLLAPMRAQPISILELGVYSGASLRMWREYFPAALLVGLDIIMRPTALDPSILYVRGDQSAAATLQAAMDMTNGESFDVIIDDASHIGSLSKASFAFLFPRALKPSGLYFIEDFGTGYIPSFPDGCGFADAADDGKVFPSHHNGMVGVVKQLLDELHMPAITPPERHRYAMESMTFLPHIVAIRKSLSRAAAE